MNHLTEETSGMRKLLEKLNTYRPHYHIVLDNKDRFSVLCIYESEEHLVADFLQSGKQAKTALVRRTEDNLKELLAEAAELCGFSPNDTYILSHGIAYYDSFHVGGNYYRYEAKYKE